MMNYVALRSQAKYNIVDAIGFGCGKKKIIWFNG